MNSKDETNDAKACHARGDAKRKLGDMQGAISDYDNAIALDPNYVLAYYNRGLAKVQLDDMQGAISDYDKVIELDPKIAKAYNNRGTANRMLGDMQGAISDYDKAIDLDPDNTMVYYGRGMAKKKLGGRQNLQQALADFEYVKNRALQLNLQDLADATQRIIERVTAELNASQQRAHGRLR